MAAMNRPVKLAPSILTADFGHLAQDIQAAEAGGVFEYAPRIRSDDSENFEAVAEVLAGDRARVHRIEIEPDSDTANRIGQTCSNRMRTRPEQTAKRKRGLYHSEFQQCDEDGKSFVEIHQSAGRHSRCGVWSVAAKAYRC